MVDILYELAEKPVGDVASNIFGASCCMLYAAGSVWWEQRLASLNPGRQRRSWRVAWAVVAAAAAIAAVVALPIGPPQWSMWNLREPELRDEVGWEELVATVASVRDSIPLEDRGRLAVLTGNYAAAGAVDLYRDQYGLPAAISPIRIETEAGDGGRSISCRIRLNSK